MSGTQQREHQQGAPGLQQLKRKVTGLAIAGAVGGFLFGFDSSVVNGAVDAIKDFALSEADRLRGRGGPARLRGRRLPRGADRGPVRPDPARC